MNGLTAGKLPLVTYQSYSGEPLFGHTADDLNFGVKLVRTITGTASRISLEPFAGERRQIEIAMLRILLR